MIINKFKLTINVLKFLQKVYRHVYFNQGIYIFRILKYLLLSVLVMRGNETLKDLCDRSDDEQEIEDDKIKKVGVLIMFSYVVFVTALSFLVFDLQVCYIP